MEPRAELESSSATLGRSQGESGDPSDAETARAVEAKCRELLALIPAPASEAEEVEQGDEAEGV